MTTGPRPADPHPRASLQQSHPEPPCPGGLVEGRQRSCVSKQLIDSYLSRLTSSDLRGQKLPKMKLASINPGLDFAVCGTQTAPQTPKRTFAQAGMLQSFGTRPSLYSLTCMTNLDTMTAPSGSASTFCLSALRSTAQSEIRA